MNNEQTQQKPQLAMNGWRAPKREKGKRLGRGTGSGKGKTCGRGHKGQRARSGARRDGGFEGGQMPLTRRVPKRGFRSRLARRTAQIRLSDLQRIGGGEITVAVLRDKGLLKNGITRARVFNCGEITVAVKVEGIAVSAGAKAAIEKAGGSVAALVKKPAQKPQKKNKTATAKKGGDNA